MLLQHAYIICDTFLAQNAAKINKKRHNLENEKYEFIFFPARISLNIYLRAVTIEVKQNLDKSHHQIERPVSQ
jgi:hypothetical protein